MPSRSGELTGVSALVGVSSDTWMFGWRADCEGRERLPNGGFGGLGRWMDVRSGHPPKPHSVILSLGAEVISLLVQKP